MLNLMRVETGKLLRSKTFWISVFLYVVAITSTFIPLSFSENMGELLDPVARLSSFTQVDAALSSIEEELAQMDELLSSMRSGGNFVQIFSVTSSGKYAVVMVIASLLITLDFSGGTIKNPLLCGYSRTQLYMAKFAGGLVGGWVFLAISMLNTLALGVCFYNMPLSTDILSYTLTIFIAQCIALVEFVAVFTATSFVTGNGWAIPASIVVLGFLPNLPVVYSLLAGREHSWLGTFLPSIASASGIASYISLEQMLAMPELWTAAFMVPALLVFVLLTAVSTAVGLCAFRSKRL